MTQQILFLCTGNYYRSRFAEILFNALARRKGLDWFADSRGLAIGQGNAGAIAPAVLKGLAARWIVPTYPERMPRALLESDLERARRVIALNRAEHFPFLLKQFPAWVDRIEYWQVPDLDQMVAEDALASIDRQVRELVKELGM